MTSPPVHYLDLRRTVNEMACGKPNVNVLNTTSPAQVTCDGCRAAIAEEAA